MPEPGAETPQQPIDSATPGKEIPDYLTGLPDSLIAPIQALDFGQRPIRYSEIDIKKGNTTQEEINETAAREADARGKLKDALTDQAGKEGIRFFDIVGDGRQQALILSRGKQAPNDYFVLTGDQLYIFMDPDMDGRAYEGLKETGGIQGSGVKEIIESDGSKNRVLDVGGQAIQVRKYNGDPENVVHDLGVVLRNNYTEAKQKALDSKKAEAGKVDFNKIQEARNKLNQEKK